MLEVRISAADLTLEEQASLTAGVDFWHTTRLERLGVGALRLTDGPCGARGERWSVGTSASLPCGSALAATWNRDLVRRVGRLLADEARAKGAQVLLAPTVNLHRHPLNGRHFECYSEDPTLTAEMAVSYIQGVQERGVGAVVKHFVCNDQEHERHTIDVQIDERPLRELYLVPFEAAVRRAGVWGVMGAYNRVRGTYCCEHTALLNRILKQEWAFDGVVVSDWFATHSTTAVAAGLDLEMPGPARFLGPHLVEAVKQGQVEPATVAEAAGRVLRLIERASRGRPEPPGEAPSEVARAAAAEAIVLLRNVDDVLPLRPTTRLAVVGPYADRLAVQGGGSAEVSPTYVTTPLAAIRARAGDVVHEPGCALPGPTPLLDYRWLADGLDLELDGERAEKLTRSLARVPRREGRGRVSGEFVADCSGRWQFGLASSGRARLLLDEQVLVENVPPPGADTFFRQGSHEALVEVDLAAGAGYRLAAEFDLDANVPQAGVRIGARPLPPPDALQRAVAAASAAEVAVVVVGYDSTWECEGADRPNLDLPGEQDALIQAIATANPRTVVVLNAGAPVSMPWAEQVAGLIQLWFPGMEGGNALADVLFGQVDPSGRLPTTFPRRLEDSPAYASYPGENGVVAYAEGLLVGYRGYEARQVEPRFCFGHGLSYTRFAYANLRVDGNTVSIEVTNAGQRPGSEVVQVYVRSSDAPYKWLVDFAKARLRPGETQTVTFVLSDRAFAHWDSGWVVAPGEYDILVGSSSQAIRATQTVSRPT